MIRIALRVATTLPPTGPDRGLGAGDRYARLVGDHVLARGSALCGLRGGPGECAGEQRRDQRCDERQNEVPPLVPLPSQGLAAAPARRSTLPTTLRRSSPQSRRSPRAEVLRPDRSDRHPRALGPCCSRGPAPSVATPSPGRGEAPRERVCPPWSTGVLRAPASGARRPRCRARAPGPRAARRSPSCRRPDPVPIGTRESKITMLTCGRAAMLRECVASGSETQKNSRRSTGANHTGETHGRPLSSALPIVM